MAGTTGEVFSPEGSMMPVNTVKEEPLSHTVINHEKEILVSIGRGFASNTPDNGTSRASTKEINTTTTKSRGMFSIYPSIRKLVEPFYPNSVHE